MKLNCRMASVVLLITLALGTLFFPYTGQGAASPPGIFTNTFTVTAKRLPPGTVINYLDPLGPANDPSMAAGWPDPALPAPVRTDVTLNYRVNVGANGGGSYIPSNPQQWRNLQVWALHDGTTLLFKFTWADPSKNDTIKDTTLFHDALGVLIPYPETLFPGCVPGPTSEPMVHMGMRCDGRDEGGYLPGDPLFVGPARCCPASVMFWRADLGEIENLTVNSPGTSRETAETDAGIYHVYQNWTAGVWTVILARPMTSPPDTSGNLLNPTVGNLVDLAPGGTTPVIFANWQGSARERDGLKFISLWGTLNLEP